MGCRRGWARRQARGRRTGRSSRGWSGGGMRTWPSGWPCPWRASLWNSSCCRRSAGFRAWSSSTATGSSVTAWSPWSWPPWRPGSGSAHDSDAGARWWPGCCSPARCSPACSVWSSPLPFAIPGVLVFGIGLLGFVPLFTSHIYYRNGRAAFRQAESRLGSRGLFEAVAWGAILVYGIPGLIQARISLTTRAALREVIEGDGPAARAAVERLRPYGWVADFDPLRRAPPGSGTALGGTGWHERIEYLTGRDVRIGERSTHRVRRPRSAAQGLRLGPNRHFSCNDASRSPRRPR